MFETKPRLYKQASYLIHGNWIVVGKIEETPSNGWVMRNVGQKSLWLLVAIKRIWTLLDIHKKSKGFIDGTDMEKNATILSSK